jgi:predicted nucleotidyltransferase component of viral defense system
MAEALVTLVNRRKPRSLDEYDRALREVVQEFMLLGLWRAKFFEKAAFYGGTALRLLHGLDRFSEDLDFSLLSPDENFSFEDYFDAIARELSALGLDSTVESAFVKLNTRKTLFTIGVAPNRLIRIKFEADTDPPPGFFVESRILLEPLPFGVKTYTPDCLFAGKYHALLERSWGERVKGRDWYDLVFFVRHGIPVNLGYLQKRLEATGSWSGAKLNETTARQRLLEKIEALDIEMALEDVRCFVADRDALGIWSRDFFRHIAGKIKFSAQ